MNTQMPFSLSQGHFAQPIVETSHVVINGQAVIDALADCDPALYDKMAALMEGGASGRHAQIGMLLEQAVTTWCK